MTETPADHPQQAGPGPSLTPRPSTLPAAKAMLGGLVLSYPMRRRDEAASWGLGQRTGPKLAPHLEGPGPQRTGEDGTPKSL